MKLSSSTLITIGVITAVVVGIYFYTRRRPTRPSSSLLGFRNLESFQNAGTVAEDLKNNPEVCKMMKNVLATVDGQLATERVQGNPAQLQLLTLTKKGIEDQLSKTGCA
jgi:hypothetical protein